MRKAHTIVLLIIGCILLQGASFLVTFNYWQIHRRAMAKTLIPQEISHIVTLTHKMSAQALHDHLRYLKRPDLHVTLSHKPLDNAITIDTKTSATSVRTIVAKNPSHIRLNLKLDADQWLHITASPMRYNIPQLLGMVSILLILLAALVGLCLWVGKQFARSDQKRIDHLLQDQTHMLAAIAHDLRTPITRITLRLESMPENPTQAKILQDLKEMEHMISSILLFAKNDYLKELTCVFDLNALLQTIADDRSDMAQVVQYENIGKTVYTGRLHAIKRALSNIINNAITYGQTAHIELVRKDNHLHITVCDQGPGIPEPLLDKVFLPFFRVDLARSPGQHGTSGTGLGLAIAHNIITAHGGTITLANRPEGGLCATVTLNIGETLC